MRFYDKHYNPIHSAFKLVDDLATSGIKAQVGDCRASVLLATDSLPVVFRLRDDRVDELMWSPHYEIGEIPGAQGKKWRDAADIARGITFGAMPHPEALDPQINDRTVKPENVRLAMAGDEDAIFDILALAHAENGCAPMNDLKVRRGIKDAIEQRGGVLGVIDGPTGFEGVLMLRLSQWWYSEEWHLDELCNFVHPNFRSSNHAKSLLQFGKWFAEQMNRPLFIGVMTHTRMEAKNRLYRRQLHQGGALFYHNLTYGLLAGMH